MLFIGCWLLAGERLHSTFRNDREWVDLKITLNYKTKPPAAIKTCISLLPKNTSPSTSTVRSKMTSLNSLINAHKWNRFLPISSSIFTKIILIPFLFDKILCFTILVSKSDNMIATVSTKLVLLMIFVSALATETEKEVWLV